MQKLIEIAKSKACQRSTGKPSDINFSGRPKKQKKYQNAKMCWKKKMPRDMKILAIYPSTRGLYSIGKRGFHHVL